MSATSFFGSSFFGGGFFYDFHDLPMVFGKPEPTKRFREAQLELRAQLHLAIYGPEKEEVRAAIAPHVQPAKPIESLSLDWHGLMADVRAMKAIADSVSAERARQALMEDDRDVMLLLEAF